MIDALCRLLPRKFNGSELILFLRWAGYLGVGERPRGD